MIIETKFSINDVVWAIHLGRRKSWIICEACEGAGKITLKDKKPHCCPVCYGRFGKTEYFETEWSVQTSLTIGEVQAKITNITKDDIFENVGHYEEGKDKRKVDYMAYETGVGSGTMWPEEVLFPTREEAQAECDKRNKN